MKAGLRADLHAPAAARRVVATALPKVLDGASRPGVDEILLVVSELVTNAVRAGATAVEVELSATSHHVVLSVSDDAAGWPTTRDAEWDDPSGRGLAIIDALADEWRASLLARGKRVTARWRSASTGT